MKRSKASDQLLRVEVLLEHTRGSRGEHNSRTMLLPLVQNFSDVVKVSLYHSPSLRGLLKLLLPERFNETVALTHLKVYLTDDTIIMSGSVISFVFFSPLVDNLISTPSLIRETSQHFVTHGWFPCKMTSQKQVQKFYTDNTSLSRSG